VRDSTYIKVFSTARCIFHYFQIRMFHPNIGTDPQHKEGSWMEADVFLQDSDVELADLICFYRGWYYHWGIYDGDGYVIHVPAESKNGIQCTIRRENLVDVAKKVPEKTRVRIDNLYPAACSFYCNGLKGDLQRSIETQLEAARNMIGQTVDYNFLTNNCEHFVTRCKYGYGFCTQAGT